MLNVECWYSVSSLLTLSIAHASMALPSLNRSLECWVLSVMRSLCFDKLNNRCGPWACRRVEGPSPPAVPELAVPEPVEGSKGRRVYSSGLIRLLGFSNKDVTCLVGIIDMYLIIILLYLHQNYPIWHYESGLKIELFMGILHFLSKM